MVATQIILLSQQFSKKKPSKKNQLKRPTQNGQVQNDLSRMTFWWSWTWGFFWPKFPIKKAMISCNEMIKMKNKKQHKKYDL
jgi:hypothetical protein